jgi:hypothetical protein
VGFYWELVWVVGVVAVVAAHRGVGEVIDFSGALIWTWNFRYCWVVGGIRVEKAYASNWIARHRSVFVRCD